MHDPYQLREEHRRLVSAARVPALRPEQVHPVVDVGVTTASRDGRRTLSVLRYELEAGHRTTMEIGTFVRQSILASRAEAFEDEHAIVAEYLEREARRALALRSLDLAEGETERGGRHSGTLTLDREAMLPPPTPTALRVDGVERAAQTIEYELHAATWADLPDLGVAAVLYARAWPELPALVSRGP